MIGSTKRRTLHLFIRAVENVGFRLPVKWLIPGQIFDMWTLLEICTEFKIKSTSNDQKKDRLKIKRLLWMHDVRGISSAARERCGVGEKVLADFQGPGHCYVD